MVEKKFSKEEWFNLTKEEQDFHTLEFQKSVESRKRKVIFATRGIAILCILVLFFIGYVQFQAVNSATKAITQYGSLGYCYLCGQQNLRSCQCQYQEVVSTDGKYHPTNLTDISLKTAEGNIAPCPSREGNAPLINSSQLENLWIINSS